MGEKWDEALFGAEAAKEILPEGSGGRALEENKKAQASLKAEIEKASENHAPLEDIKRMQGVLKKFQEDETRIRAGGV